MYLCMKKGLSRHSSEMKSILIDYLKIYLVINLILEMKNLKNVCLIKLMDFVVLLTKNGRSQIIV